MDYFHCNKCGLEPVRNKLKQFYLTNCGHIFCESCQDKDCCYICKISCNTLKISPEMPPEIKNFLSQDYIELAQQLCKILEFRSDHYQRMKEFNQKLFLKYENLKLSHLKLLEEYKKLRKENEWLKRAPQVPKPVLKNMMESTPQSRNQQSTPASTFLLRPESQSNRPSTKSYLSSLDRGNNFSAFRNNDYRSIDFATPASSSRSVLSENLRSSCSSASGSKRPLPGITPPEGALKHLSIGSWDPKLKKPF